MPTGGVAGGEEIGKGNYLTPVCKRCSSNHHVVWLIKDANLAVVVCPTCAQISMALKLDAGANPDDITAEIESREDVATYIQKLKLKLGEETKEPAKEN